MRLPLLFFAIGNKNFYGGKCCLEAIPVVDDFAFFLQFLDVLVQAQFGDGAHGGGAHFQRYPFPCFRHKKLLRLQVWVKTALCFSVGVRNVVAANWPFTR